MRTALLLTGSIFVLAPCFAQEPGRAPDATAVAVEKLTSNFRKAFWGDSQSQVMGKETAEFLGSSGKDLEYKTEAAGVSVTVFYSFVDDKLVTAGNFGEQAYFQTAIHLDDYAKFKEILTEKYGEPEMDEQIWLDDLFRYERDRSSMGMAIKLGHLKYFARWESSDTKISLVLGGKEFEVTFGVSYISKEFSHPADKQKQKEEKEDLADF